MDVVGAFFDFSGWVADNPNIWNGMVIGLGAVTTAMVLLNAVMAANPVGAILLAIVGLITLTTFAVTNWNQIIGMMVGGFQILFGGMLGLFEGFVNGIIDGINTVIGVVNLLGADLGEVGKVDFGANAMIMTGLQTQNAAGATHSVPRASSGYRGGMYAFAEGGIVTGPTMGLVGEAGPEAIIPLDRLGKMSSGGSTYNITVSAMNADARVGEMIVSAIKRYERSNGPVFAGA
jgi:hypothetical protein